MHINNKIYRQFTVAIVGIWLAIDALNKLFASQVSSLTYRFYEYGILDLMIPWAWIQLFVVMLYIRKKSRSTGYVLLTGGLLLISFFRLQNGDGIAVQLLLIFATTFEQLIGSFSTKNLSKKIQSMLCNNFTTIKRHFDC